MVKKVSFDALERPKSAAEVWGVFREKRDTARHRPRISKHVQALRPEMDDALRTIHHAALFQPRVQLLTHGLTLKDIRE